MSKQIKIVVDPGHGGKDPGALSPSGIREADIALEVAKLYVKWLSKIPDIEVFLTRGGDTFIELSDRAAHANKLNADFFLSIHLNSAKTPAKGFEAFTSHGHTKSDVAVNYLLDEYHAELPELTNRGAKEAGFTVLTRTKMPAILFELEFIHTRDGEKIVSSHKVLSRMARALAVGTLKFFEIEPFVNLNGDLVKLPESPPPHSPPVGTIEDGILRVRDLTLSDLEQLGIEVTKELAIRVPGRPI